MWFNWIIWTLFTLDIETCYHTYKKKYKLCCCLLFLQCPSLAVDMDNYFVRIFSLDIFIQKNLLFFFNFSTYTDMATDGDVGLAMKFVKAYTAGDSSDGYDAEALIKNLDSGGNENFW